MGALKIVQIHEDSVKTTCFDGFEGSFLVLQSHCFSGVTFTTEKYQYCNVIDGRMSSLRLKSRFKSLHDSVREA